MEGGVITAYRIWQGIITRAAANATTLGQDAERTQTVLWGLLWVLRTAPETADQALLLTTIQELVHAQAMDGHLTASEVSAALDPTQILWPDGHKAQAAADVAVLLAQVMDGFELEAHA